MRSESMKQSRYSVPSAPVWRAAKRMGITTQKSCPDSLSSGSASLYGG
jgi:hypothetical protein